MAETKYTSVNLSKDTYGDAVRVSNLKLTFKYTAERDTTNPYTIKLSLEPQVLYNGDYWNANAAAVYFNKNDFSNKKVTTYTHACACNKNNDGTRQTLYGATGTTTASAENQYPSESNGAWVRGEWSGVEIAGVDELATSLTLYFNFSTEWGYGNFPNTIWNDGTTRDCRFPVTFEIPIGYTEYSGGISSILSSGGTVIKDNKDTTISWVSDIGTAINNPAKWQIKLRRFEDTSNGATIAEPSSTSYTLAYKTIVERGLTGTWFEARAVYKPTYGDEITSDWLKLSWNVKPTKPTMITPNTYYLDNTVGTSFSASGSVDSWNPNNGTLTQTCSPASLAAQTGTNGASFSVTATANDGLDNSETLTKTYIIFQRFETPSLTISNLSNGYLTPSSALVIPPLMIGETNYRGGKEEIIIEFGNTKIDTLSREGNALSSSTTYSNLLKTIYDKLGKNSFTLDSDIAENLKVTSTITSGELTGKSRTLTASLSIAKVTYSASLTQADGDIPIFPDNNSSPIILNNFTYEYGATAKGLDCRYTLYYRIDSNSWKYLSSGSASSKTSITRNLTDFSTAESFELGIEYEIVGLGYKTGIQQLTWENGINWIEKWKRNYEVKHALTGCKIDDDKIVDNSTSTESFEIQWTNYYTILNKENKPSTMIFVSSNATINDSTVACSFNNKVFEILNSYYNRELTLTIVNILNFKRSETSGVYFQPKEWTCTVTISDNGVQKDFFESTAENITGNVNIKANTSAKLLSSFTYNDKFGDNIKEELKSTALCSDEFTITTEASPVFATGDFAIEEVSTT